MGRKPRDGGPRSMRGGRSDRHAERHDKRGHARVYSCGWSDGAALAVLQAIHDKAEGKVTAFTLELLRNTDRARDFVRGLRLSERERDIARDIIGTHALKVMSQSSDREAIKRTRAFLKPLIEAAEGEAPRSRGADDSPIARRSGHIPCVASAEPASGAIAPNFQEQTHPERFAILATGMAALPRHRVLRACQGAIGQRERRTSRRVIHERGGEARHSTNCCGQQF